jgi:proteasome lid subunit RPN8/RPN11
MMKYPSNAEVLQNYEKSGRIITIASADVELLLQHAKKNFPEEACGLIAGTEDGQGNRSIKKVYLLTNIDHSREHFSLDPMEQLQAVKDMRKNGYTPLGNWHSHPESPSRPSEEDIRLSYDSNASYMILSLMEEEPVLRSFHVEEGQVTIEELEIRE